MHDLQCDPIVLVSEQSTGEPHAQLWHNKTVRLASAARLEIPRAVTISHNLVQRYLKVEHAAMHTKPTVTLQGFQATHCTPGLVQDELRRFGHQ